MTKPDQKIRENRIRRMAVRQMLRLEKSRRRDPRAVDYGGYRNVVVLGATSFAYSATLDDVEAYLTNPTHARWKKGKDGQFRWHTGQTDVQP